MTDVAYDITRDIARYSPTDDPSHHWTLTIDGDAVAELWASTETGEVENVATKPGHQRCGYATALYRQAATEIEIFHAPEIRRSIEGNAFAAAVGGPSLPHDPNCWCAGNDLDEE